MVNSKSTKRALLTSALAILACVAMLIGTTFAWFTDTASTSVNKITSGKLEVQILDKNDKPVSELQWLGTNGEPIADQEGILWEPGCTYKLTPFKIANTGNLALKYKIVITGLDGEAGLLKVIKFTYATEDGKVFDMSAEGHLTAKGTDGATTKMITVSAHMDEAAGNEYQEKTLTGVKFTVYATQDTVEYDSNDNQYDKNATYYPVIDAAGLQDALANGGDVLVSKDVNTSGEDTLDACNIIKKPTTLQLDKKIISPDNMGNNKTNFVALVVKADTTINAGPEGGIDTGVNGGYAINVMNGAKLTINSGTYYGGGTAVQVQEGELVINGGFFEVEPYSNPVYGNKFLLNCIDAAHEDGTATITVYGGTFVNYDPSDSASENPHGNFVAEGYSVISETKANGDVWYTVVKGTGVVAGTQDALDTAIKGNTEVTVKLTESGSYTLPSGMDGKDVTIIGTKDTVIDLSTGAAHHGATIALEGVTVKGQTEGDFQGLQHTEKVVYKNCTITGKQTLYANDVEFIGCKFDSGTDYAIWTYGAKNVTFTKCDFVSGNNSKSVLCYSVLRDQTFTRTFNDCTFAATGKADKSAIMINPTESGGGTNTYIVNINNCTATGYAENGIGGQTVVGLRNAGAGVIDTITVNINGKTVYTH